MTQYELNNAFGDGMSVYLWDLARSLETKRKVFFWEEKTSGLVELWQRSSFTAENILTLPEGTSRLELFLQGLAWFAEYEKWIAWAHANAVSRKLSRYVSSQRTAWKRIY